MAKGKGSAAVKLETIHGIKVELLKEPVLDAAFERLRAGGLIDFDTPKSIKDKVAAMQRYTKDVKAKHPSRIGDCDDCGQDSDAEALECCPYCGAGDEDTATPGAIAPAEAPSGVVAAVVPAQSAAMTPAVPEVHGTLLTAATLDADVLEIKELKKTGRVAEYLIAKKLALIEQEQRWKLRLTDEGKSAYRTIEQWAAEEIGFSRRYMRQYLQIAARFDEQTINTVGPTKLAVILQLTPEAQKEALELAKKGAGKRDLERMNPNRKGKHLDVGDKRGVKGDKAKNAIQTNTITVAALEGTKTIKLFAKPPSPSTPKAEWKGAKRIDDVPFGSLDLANDVRMFFTITRDPTGFLKMVIKTRRVDSDAE